MTKNPVSALVVGTGFGCRIHVPALRAAGFEVVGLVGRNLERLEKKAAQLDIPAFYTDLDEAIQKTGAQVVTIATTPDTHGSLALQALEHGCHVLCEKPFVSNAKEGQVLLKKAEEKGVVHMLSHEFRWLPERALFGRMIAEGAIGEPRFFVMDQFIPFCADPEARLPKWWFDKASGGGWLGAGGSHLIDQIRVWLGEFHSLSANLMVVSDRKNVAEDSYSMRFITDSGVEGSMQQTAGAWGGPASLCRCAGTKGSVWIDGGKVFVADKSGTQAVELPADLELPPPPPADDKNPSNRLSHFELGPFTRLCEVMMNQITGSGNSSSVAVPTFADGLAAMRIMDAMRTSAESGGTLQVL